MGLSGEVVGTLFRRGLRLTRRLGGGWKVVVASAIAGLAFGVSSMVAWAATSGHRSDGARGPNYQLQAEALQPTGQIDSAGGTSELVDALFADYPPEARAELEGVELESVAKGSFGEVYLGKRGDRAAPESFCLVVASPGGTVGSSCVPADAVSQGRLVSISRDLPGDPLSIVVVLPDDASGASFDGEPLKVEGGVAVGEFGSAPDSWVLEIATDRGVLTADLKPPEHVSDS